jgi:uncharacterized protein (DUF2062 family)
MVAVLEKIFPRQLTLFISANQKICIMRKLNKRFFIQLYLKLVRNGGSPEYVARGVAVGLFIGLIIPFGFQLIFAYALAWVVRAAKIPALFFTLITNPYSIPFIYPVQCYIGSYLIGRPLSYSYLNKAMAKIIRESSYESLFDLGMNVAAAFFAGGLLFAIIATVPGYFVSRWLVKNYRNKKQQRANRITVTTC